MTTAKTLLLDLLAAFPDGERSPFFAAFGFKGERLLLAQSRRSYANSISRLIKNE
jgi:hypothetical protein